MRTALALCLSAALCGCGLTPTQIDDVRFRSVRVTRLVNIPGLALQHPQFGPDAIVYEVQFSTRADLAGLRPAVENQLVNDDSRCTGEANKGASAGGLTALPGIYDSKRHLVVPGQAQESAATARHPERLYYTHFAIRISEFPNAQEATNAPPRLCFALGGGDLIRGRVASNVVTVPSVTVANAMSRSDSL